MLWLKFKLLVNLVQKEKEKEIESVWADHLRTVASSEQEEREECWKKAAEIQWKALRRNLEAVALVAMTPVRDEWNPR